MSGGLQPPALEPLPLPPLDRGPHVFLSGPMGAGKSTVARELGALLRRPMLDLDRAIESHCAATVAEVFRRRGEAAFRAIEAELAQKIAGDDVPLIAALGGGTVVDAETRALLHQRGTVVTLGGSAEVLAARTAGPERPLLAGVDRIERLASLIEARREPYAEAAVVLDTSSRTPAEVAVEIARALGERPILIPLGVRSYRVTFGDREGVGELLPPSVDGVVLVSCDEHTADHAAAVVASIAATGRLARLVTLPSGEENKTVRSLERLWDAAGEDGVSRDGAMIAVGGGVVGDVTGLAAATWLRGVRFGVVPTTLLSMADSAIGGKTAIDHRGVKNTVGAFHQPSFVRIDVRTLATLPERDRRAGLAEVVKCAWLAGEGAIAKLESSAEALARGEEGATLDALELACRVKARIVAADETEQGARRALNLGHTVGHAIESASGFQLVHGEAVALGLVAALRVARSLGVGDGGDRLVALLGRLGLPVDLDGWLDAPGLVERLAADKKRSGVVLRFVVPTRLGQVAIARLSPDDVLRRVREFGSEPPAPVR